MIIRFIPEEDRKKGDDVSNEYNVVISPDPKEGGFAFGKMRCPIWHEPAASPMRFFHSYWSKPALAYDRWMLKHQFALNAVYSLCSALCIKAGGHKIVLHTDSAGRDILSFIPYDEIYTSLDFHGMPTLFWASGKVKAIDLEADLGLGGIHIDTDLFIHSDDAFNRIAESDITISHYEDTARYAENIKRYTERITQGGVQVPWGIEEKTVINAGLMKASRKAMKGFANSYGTLVRHISRDKSFFDALSADYQPYSSIDLVIEQLLLKYTLEQASKAEGVDLTVLTETRADYDLDLGYTHLISFDKYLKVPICLECIRRLSPSSYSNLMEVLGKAGYEIYVHPVLEKLACDYL